APLSFEIARFFTGLGVQVLEGYGLTETFAASTANRRNDFRFGTVGKPVKGVEIKLSGDGEVMIKGPTVFKG
ncbi:MAG: AMP-binding protein, partial [Desulfuromonadales bacterium]|nr:AMP-binding protein [Desulfuromonadales bacterium]NIS39655.1 AMP-binding protein [Desulfuromonadales bacterium]